VIISRTPYRISFFGGGTDYPEWYREHGGEVLATTIDKYCYITCRYLPPFFQHRIRLVYSKIEDAQTVAEIQHPAVRAVLTHLAINRGLEIHHDGDLPARSGIGSSSSFTVGLLNAVHALHGRMVGKRQLALDAIYLEQEVLKENVGSQDQVLAAHGGFNHIEFHPDGQISVHPVTLTPHRIRELNNHLMLFYTGIARTSSDVAATFLGSLDSRRRPLRIMRDLVSEGLSVLGAGGDIETFGRLLHELWQVKKGLSDRVSSTEVDGLYESARAAGAIGGKLTGAGGGGFLLLFVPPDRRQSVRQALERLIHVPFAFESSGSQIIFFDPEADYAAEEQMRAGQLITPFRSVDAASVL
jgi:D-glycero-alpha-D-manno-heptose-7-phosphate kinase